MGAHGDQHGLDLALASLAGQTYPDDLLEVVVVDDHTSPPLRLPALRPAHSRIVTVPAGHWGPGTHGPTAPTSAPATSSCGWTPT